MITVRLKILLASPQEREQQLLRAATALSTLITSGNASRTRFLYGSPNPDGVRALLGSVSFDNGDGT